MTTNLLQTFQDYLENNYTHVVFNGYVPKMMTMNEFRQLNEVAKLIITFDKDNMVTELKWRALLNEEQGQVFFCYSSGEAKEVYDKLMQNVVLNPGIVIKANAEGIQISEEKMKIYMDAERQMKIQMIEQSKKTIENLKEELRRLEEIEKTQEKLRKK